MNERELWKSLIETWIRHGEAELDLLRRLERALIDSPGAPSGTEEPAQPAGSVDSEAPTVESDASREGSEAPPLESDASREDSEAPPVESDASRGDSEAPPVESDASREDSEAPPEEQVPVADVPLLLVGQSDTWVGFPWDRVERVALTEEVELPEESEYRFSLGAILQVDREEEPYSLVWTQDGGPATLACARIGGIVTIDGAVDRGIGIVIHPGSRGHRPNPTLLSLTDFIAALRAKTGSDSERERAGHDEPGQQHSGAPEHGGEDNPSSRTFASPAAEHESEGGGVPSPAVQPKAEDGALASPTAEHGPEDDAFPAAEHGPEDDASPAAEHEPHDDAVSSPATPQELEGDEIASAARERELGDEDIGSSDPEPSPDDEETDSIYDALPDPEPASLEHLDTHQVVESAPNDLPKGGGESKPAAHQLNGGRRSIPHALVAVHYLPARVAVVRMLRSAGWSVEEEAQPNNLSRRLQQGPSPDVLFVEPTGPIPESTQERLQELLAHGSRVVVLGSRLRPGREMPEGVLGRAPRLRFPFTEEESRELLGYLRVPASDPRPAG